MKFIKKIIYDTRNASYVDKAELMVPAITAVTAFAVAGVCAGVGVINALFGYITAAVFAALGIVALSRALYCLRFPYNVVVDDEHLFIRKGAGYLKFHKFEIGSVVYRSGNGGESGADGHGTERFFIEPLRITFRNDIKPIKRNVRNGEKLAYVLLSIVQNPHSGVDWSLAYDSLPADKRSPDAF